MKIKVVTIFSKDFFDAFQRLLKLKMKDVSECIKIIKLAKAFEEEKKTYLTIKEKLFSDFNYHPGDPIVGEFGLRLQQFLESEFEIKEIDKIKLDPQKVVGEISAEDLLILSEILEI